ncbi:hypothetical protein F7Q99_27680 [Streptomyces kaniharaensis]|uniref:Trypsin-like serine protease n=1 Tax=Streptomyces kaniharaensis TaxID=212423 RepID=A0A6N7L2D1_9ACTN|nr:hypothetical protein [Streptomyces kaniharaensis]MQS15933.1 hypothetical protein [Streptomyces kaniharaensis]
MQPTYGDDGNDPEPATVNARAVPHPYAKNMAVHGKLVFDAPGTASKGPDDPTRHFSCSGTVVADPAHPGKSNLAWTAGHCVHGGKGSTANMNIIFIPGFNTSGAVSGRKGADGSQWAPYGLWDGADYVTSPQWKAEGAEFEAEAAQYDFGIVRVKPQNDTGKSLEETVGGAVPVWFNAPREQLDITEYGYPSAPPFDGAELERCESGKPARRSYDRTRPPMLTLGCTMTQGSSGGGWLVMKDGKPALVSNVSIGQHDREPRWQAGLYLEGEAEGLYNFIAKKG